MESYDLSVPSRPTIPKDPSAKLDYSVDLTDWLALIGDSIASFTVTLSGGLVQHSAPTRSGGVLTAWVKDGTPGALASITFDFITTATPPRSDHRTLYLQMTER
jgi:hypothetical protein